MSEIDHKFTSEVVCPYCGYEHSDSWEYGELEGDILDCHECGKKFLATRNVQINYSTRQCACLNDEADHKWSEWREIALIESVSHFRRYCRGCGKDERKQQAKEAQGE